MQQNCWQTKKKQQKTKLNNEVGMAVQNSTYDAIVSGPKFHVRKQYISIIATNINR